MTHEQYRKAITKLGFTSQLQASEWLGVSQRTGQSWALGQSRIPEPVAKLLRLVISKGIKPEEVR